MSELFNEVDEEVRREQLKKLWDQIFDLHHRGLMLIIAGVGGWRGYQYVEAKKAAEAGAAFDRAVELADANKHAEAEAAFADLAAKAPFGYRVLSRLRMAGEVVQPRASRPRSSCSTRSRPTAASASPSGIWRAFALPSCCWKPLVMPT